MENSDNEKTHQNSQETAFLEAFEEYADALFRHALFRLNDRDRALDVAQEAFFKAWKYIADGKSIEQYRPFLYRTLNNLIIDIYRKREPSSLDALLESENTQEGNFPELVDVSFESISTEIDAQKVFALVLELPDRYRQVITLRFIDQLSLGEIAEYTGERENAVSVRLHRALKAMKKLAEKKGYE